MEKNEEQKTPKTTLEDKVKLNKVDFKKLLQISITNSSQLDLPTRLKHKIVNKYYWVKKEHKLYLNYVQQFYNQLSLYVENNSNKRLPITKQGLYNAVSINRQWLHNYNDTYYALIFNYFNNQVIENMEALLVQPSYSIVGIIFYLKSVEHYEDMNFQKVKIDLNISNDDNETLKLKDIPILDNDNEVIKKV